MAFKVDGGAGVSNIRREESVIKKIEVKTQVFRHETSSNNASVIANKLDSTDRAEMMRARLIRRFSAPVTQAVSTLTSQEAAQKADEIINRNGGKNNLDTEAVGRELATIAKTNPADAWAITQAMLGDTIDQGGRGKIKENDKDEIAQSFARNLSDTDLQTIGTNSDGKQMLERFRSHLLSGNVHDDERADALRLETAAKGYAPPQLTGNPEEDIKIIADDLQNIPADKRDDYLLEVMKYGQYGGEVLQRAGLLDEDQRNVLAGALSDAYRQDPATVSRVLNQTLDNPELLPIGEQTGLADVIRRTGNDSLIAGYAKHAMDIANSGKVDSYTDTSGVNALTALGGMSPEGLRNFINFGSAAPPRYGSPSTIGDFIKQNNDNFYKMLGDTIDNYQPWITGSAVENLLNKASQMTNADGKLSNEAIRIFSTIAPRFSDEVFANGAVSKFFNDHADEVLESLLQTNEGQAVLQKFFKNTLFSTDLPADVRTKMEDAISKYVGDQVANSGTDAPIVGDKIGELLGTIQAAGRDALADASDAEKDKIKEFTVGVLGKVVGALVGKGVTALGTSIGGPGGTAAGLAANAIIGQILGNVFKVSDPDPAKLAEQFIKDLEAAGGDINLGENMLEELNDKFNQVLADLNAEIARTTDPAIREQLDEARTRLEQLLRSMNDSYQTRLND